MRNFFLFCLALALVLVGAMVHFYVPNGLAAASDVEIGKTANLISLKSSHSNPIAQDGILMEISVPYFVLPIPGKRLGFSTPLAFAVDITNNTANLIRAGYDNLIPELIGLDGQALRLQRARDRRFDTRTFCGLVKPGQRTGFILGGLSWENNKLQIKGDAGLGYIWYFDNLKPGTYQLRFTYYSPGGEVSCYDLETQEFRKLEGLATARSATTFIPIHLVQPVSIDSNTVEIDGIRFEIVMPERVLTIPENKPGMTIPVKLGLRITNKTATPFRFTWFDTLIPQVIAPDGKTLRSEGGRSATSRPTPSDCPLVQPEESVTFFRDAKLSWQNNKLQLGGSDGFGGFWYFDALKPDTYQISIVYSLKIPGPPLACDSGIRGLMPLQNIWQGFGYTPFVEVRLVKPRI